MAGFFYDRKLLSAVLLRIAAFAVLLETIFLEVAFRLGPAVLRIVAIIVARTVAEIASWLVAAWLEITLAFARSSVAASACNGRTDHEALFTGTAFFNRTTELISLGSNNFKTRFVVENLDRTDFALGNVTGLTDQRQKPLRIGAVLTSGGNREPDAIETRIAVEAFALLCTITAIKAFATFWTITTF